ncbi:hypothetical protein CORAM0001_0873 [Corynebacterium amycolatum SK46]|nr:hypothetical protein CORAM0001_0873 [Corynebacterium amycolatum SK46]
MRKKGVRARKSSGFGADWAVKSLVPVGAAETEGAYAMSKA